MKNLTQPLLISLLLATALLYCTSPTEPVLDNPYDEQSEAYIPTPDLNTAPVQPRATSAITGGIFETDFGRVIQKGVCWSTNENPTIEDDCTNDGEGIGTFESIISGLEVQTQYFVRAYATNADGTIYGGQRSFTTRDGVPEIETGSVTEIRAFTTRTGGIISDDGGATITERGVCYGTQQNSGLSDSCITSGNGSGAFEVTLEELTPDTQYFVRAYATNAVGTVFGNEQTFTTRDGVPSLTTTEPFDIGDTFARTGGTITDDGGADITEAGVCYVEGTGAPDLNDICIAAPIASDTFEVLLEDLVLEETYTVRSYATNELATAWGDIYNFTTSDWPIDRETEVVNVTNPTTGRTWMDRNLGASRAATSSTDAQAYGDLYQWGRAVDGHQKRNSPTTSTLSSTDQPGHGDFILAPNSPSDWRSPRNDNLWQGVNGVNNPCPSGYRLPTEAEWNAERNSWSSNNANGAFNSQLKLTRAGRRAVQNGNGIDDDIKFWYWSSTIYGERFASALFLDENVAGVGGRNFFRGNGFSVRCLED
ncbi:major paralogous domain-containing protein [Cyclonatronum proteinivorum]|uniref:Major paralogous domain-containing protein n=1 Tax=Cyclonatronum proteinivorum TaxID=1457365 RepID=A0A345UH06_9BACT|nr:FISUMP domain-containing protein [Cyclonatronum proteinivorum]AXI99757.1 major paralogous domain-containing protein [Cyclonatronum proteinivorum]